MENILYSSTRGGYSEVTSCEAIIKGIAEDGGLFVPSNLPYIGNLLEDIKNMDYKQLAFFIMSRLLTDFEEKELRDCIDNAYNSKFDTPNIAPVKKVGGQYFLELYHGPTLAFKDMALSILPHLLKTSAKKLKVDKEIVILTATSGDTGKAALEGFSDVEGTKIIVFFPEDGVSEVQKMQMTTHKGNNTYVVGVRGNFDDAQNGVKEIFSDREIGSRLDKSGFMFSSANSINAGRLIPQIVYYFHAYNSLFRKGEIACREKINIAVPTGNFGNILAAYYAKIMGLPVNKLICASNDNKVLYDFINTGVYDRTREFFTTISPSMDILISSNLERLLFEISGRDSEVIKELMKLLKEKGVYEITEDMKNKLTDFYGGFASEDDTRHAIKEVFDNSNYLMDTHTAVAYKAYTDYKKQTGDDTKTIIASTASPYKFASSVMSALDSSYKGTDNFKLMKEMSRMSCTDVPQPILDMENKPVIHKDICEKDEMKQKVADYLKL